MPFKRASGSQQARNSFSERLIGWRARGPTAWSGDHAGLLLTIIAAVLGAAGSVGLYRGSFAFEVGAYYGSPEVARNRALRTARRQRQQRLGLRLLLAAFVLQGVSAFLP